MGGRGSSSSSNSANVDSIYKPQNAYESYMEKMYKYSGTTTNADGSLNYGEKTFLGTKYTNDEFMEALDDGNWHSLRKAIIDANLTERQVTQIKNNMKFGLWSYGSYKGLKESNYKTTAEYNAAIIKSVKAAPKALKIGKSNVEVKTTMPKGWVVDKGATTAPRGYEWISNNKSLFGGKRKSALLYKG